MGDENQTRGLGGSYVIDETGARRLVERTRESRDVPSSIPALGSLDELITDAAPAKPARKPKE